MRAEEVCQQIVEFLIRRGYVHQVSLKDIEKAIMSIRGIDERTIKRWTKALIVFEYIKPVSPYTFQLNPLKIPHLIKKLKEQPQTKIVM